MTHLSEDSDLIGKGGEGRASGRVIAWFSSGAASAVMTKLALTDDHTVLPVQCDLGRSEDKDNRRFTGQLHQPRRDEMASVTLPTLERPADILARYETALANDQIVQGEWHSEKDGRWLACALGVIGDAVDSPKHCPASVMPRWLAQMVPPFFDRQKLDDAKDWGLRFYKALAAVDGNVPFVTVHHWHAHTVCQLGIDAAEKRERDTAPHVALQALHLRALAGETISADEWRPVLKNADADADADAYAYPANAYAYAAANTYAHADADADAYAWKRLADGMIAAINSSVPA